MRPAGKRSKQHDDENSVDGRHGCFSPKSGRFKWDRRYEAKCTIFTVHFDTLLAWNAYSKPSAPSNGLHRTNHVRTCRRMLPERPSPHNESAQRLRPALGPTRSEITSSRILTRQPTRHQLAPLTFHFIKCGVAGVPPVSSDEMRVTLSGHYFTNKPEDASCISDLLPNSNLPRHLVSKIRFGNTRPRNSASEDRRSALLDRGRIPRRPDF